MTTRTANLSFAQMGAILAAHNSTEQTPVTTFICANPTKGDAISEPMKIIHVQRNAAKGELYVIGDDGNTRTCQIRRLSDNKIIAAKMGNELYDMAQLCKERGVEVKFVAAGGNNTNKWFYKFA
jgi:hypothetical protein